MLKDVFTPFNYPTRAIPIYFCLVNLWTFYFNIKADLSFDPSALDIAK